MPFTGSQTAAEVSVATTGSLVITPTTTTAPTGITATPPATGQELGFASDKGIVIASSSTQTDISTWQGATIARTLTTAGKVEVSFSLLQSNDIIKALWFGQVKNADGSYSLDPSNFGAHFSLWITVIDTGRNVQFLYYFPDCAITARNDKNLVALDAIQSGLKVTAYKKSGYAFKEWELPLALVS